MASDESPVMVAPRQQTEVSASVGDLRHPVERLDEALLLRVLTDVKRGDFSVRMPLAWTGIAGKIADTLNEVIAANQSFEDELARVSRVVGKEGSSRSASRSQVRHASGRSASTRSTSLIDDLVRPTSEMQRVIGAVADGDLSKKITADVHGEVLELKTTINAMVDQLNGFVSEVTRVAREVGTEGKLGQAAAVTIEVGGVWKDLTDNVNLMAGNLTGQVRNIAEVTTAVANGDLSKKITADVKGEFLELKNTVNAMVDQLNRFASEVTRVAREVGVEGKLGGQAQSAEVAGVWKDLTDNVNQLAANLTNQVRAIADVATAVTEGDLTRQVGVRGERRGRSSEGQAQRDDPQPQRDDAPEHRAGLAEDQPRALHPDAAGAARPRDGFAHDPLGAGTAGLGAARRVLHAREPRGRRRTGADLPGRVWLQGAKASREPVPSRRGTGRAVRAGEAAHPADGRPRRLRQDQLRAGRVHAAEHHRAADPLRRIRARRRRARLVQPVQPDPPGVPRPAYREHRPGAQHDRGQHAHREPAQAVAVAGAGAAGPPGGAAHLQRGSRARQASRLAEQYIEVERKNQEVELAKRLVEEKAEQLAVSSKYKSEFFANMSHELRTPLNSLLILAGELEDNHERNLTRRRSQYASVIRSSGNDLLRLLNDILDLAKVESGTVTLESASWRSVELKNAIERRLRSRRRERGLSSPSSSHRAAAITTDAGRLRQVLKNLLANAFKFTERGGVSVSIGLADGGWSAGAHESLAARNR